MKIYSDNADRIIKNNVQTVNGCWEWNGTTRNGYGRLIIGSRKDHTRKSESAHRLSYETFIGEIPNGMYVCHKCDNKKCVNPEHLFIGTAQDNIDDREQKGRNIVQCGRCNPHSKFNEIQVEYIKFMFLSGMTYRAISREMKCHHSSIMRIIKGESWKSGSCAKNYIHEQTIIEVKGETDVNKS